VLGQLPRVSTDIAAAWKVVEKLGSDDLFLTIRLLPDADYECAAENEIGEALRLGDSGSVKAASAPLAICRAALFANSGAHPTPSP
jgi:hypothetical protein